MNLLSEQATIERIASMEAELATLRVEAHIRARLPIPPSEATMRTIVTTAAVLFGFTVGEIIGESRAKGHCRARFAAIRTIRQIHGFSTPRIAAAIGGRDHTTIMGALKRVEIWRDEDPEYRELTDRLTAIFTLKSEEEAVDAPGNC